MGLQTNLAYLRIGYYTRRHLPKIALEALEEGFDSPSLLILAGKWENESPFVLQQYFDDALAELGLQLPEDREARLQLMFTIAKSILEEELELFRGVEEMNEIIRSGDFDKNNKVYAYDSIGYEKIYGLYYSIEDAVLDEDYWRNSGKDFDQMIADAKKELYYEIKIWLDRLRSSTEGDSVGQSAD